MTQREIRNIAIIAHVDHGKTTLVDAMLKTTHTFRENQKEMVETLIMDSNELEREKGITILSKNTSVFYKGTKINIIDTPGHADFGGEVERVLNMASGALLLVDAADGPLPQTKFVLKKALAAKLRLIVVINKIDRKDARPAEVLSEVESLFLEIADDENALHFLTLYGVGRDGKVFRELPNHYTSDMPGDLTPLFDAIVSEVANSAVEADKPFQLLISTFDYDNYVGKLCIGKVAQGSLSTGETIVLVDGQKVLGSYRVQKLFTSIGLTRQEVDQVSAGDIVALAGIPQLTIGQTIAHPKHPVSLPKIKVDEPTLKITISPNSSPFSGREGKFVTSSQIKERLLQEKETNIGLRISENILGSNFIVAGRGELHLAVLIETMRREGFELEVSKPQVIYKTIDGVITEPYEEVTIDVATDFIGVITQELAKRQGDLIDMRSEPNNMTRFVYKISSANFLGIRNSLRSRTRGTAIINSYLLGYFPKKNRLESSRNGALVAIKSGTSLSYGLENAQERGILFIGPGVAVYEGMVVGAASRDFDIEVNVCKGKKLTNVRSENADIAVRLTPPVILSLEQALDFITEDELLEVTPKSLRIRKKILSNTIRKVKDREK